jgi:prolyl-tRNA editing enzyme YbaK/EbsC (Cys-tRNA(Pro) deacylase)
MTRSENGSPALPASVQRVVAAAGAHGLRLDVVEHPAGTRTAEEAARAVGCAVDQIVKSMVFDAGGEVVLALTSGAHQVEVEVLARLVGAQRCRRADPELVRSVTGFAIGGVPPFGHTQAIRTWVDPHLLGFDVVWAAAGTPRHVFPLAPTKLIELADAETAEFTA